MQRDQHQASLYPDRTVHIDFSHFLTLEARKNEKSGRNPITVRC